MRVYHKTLHKCSLVSSETVKYATSVIGDITKQTVFGQTASMLW